MQLTQLLLGAILGAVFFVPAGYIIRVWLSRATDSVALPPRDDDVYVSLDRHRDAINEHGTSLGQMASDLQLMESKLTLMSVEIVDFFDKTRKSEERTRGLARRAEAAIGEDGDTSEADQRLLGLMEERAAEQEAPVASPVGSRDEYYASKGRPS